MNDIVQIEIVNGTLHCFALKILYTRKKELLQKMRDRMSKYIFQTHKFMSLKLLKWTCVKDFTCHFLEGASELNWATELNWTEWVKKDSKEILETTYTLVFRYT